MAKKKMQKQIDIEKLAARLRYTDGNVYRIHEMMFGEKCEESIFGRLEKEAGIFRCEECSRWQPLDERDMQYGEDEDATRMCFGCSGGEAGDEYN